MKEILAHQLRFLRHLVAPAFACILLRCQAVTAGENANGARLIASPEPGWPQFRGPRRDEICDETGLLRSWPAEGPKLVWKTNGLGRGYSIPIITRGRIYLAGEVDDQLRIFCLDLHGRELWQSQNGRAWNGPYPGARASCTYSEGRLYHMNAYGRVCCLDAGSGKEIWAVDMFERFGGKAPTWATSENVLVDGSRVIITPGGTRALMAALDTKTGDTIWASEPLRLGESPSASQERLASPASGMDNCGYASPILVRTGDRRMIVNCSLQHAFGVDADTGKLLWTRPLPTRYSVIAAAPVLAGDSVFVTAPDTSDGGKLYRIQLQAGGVAVETVWKTPLDTCHGGVIHVGDRLYGSWYRRGKGWVCVDSGTGVVRYQMNDMDMGSMLYADGRLYCLSQDGEMVLLEPASDRFQVTGRFRFVPEGKSDVWSHPVILDGKLYLRYQETLFCYDVDAK